MSGEIQEVVAVFDTAEQLEDAVFALEQHGFDRAAFSLLASEHAVERTLGQPYGAVREMEDAPKTPRDTFFSRVSRVEADVGLPALFAAIGGLAVGGALVPALVAAGTGAAFGVVLARMLHRHYSEPLHEQMERGGVLLWVNVRNPAERDSATQILTQKGARDVHAHTLAAGDRTSGAAEGQGGR